MSRLDYFTIAIVAICIFALVYLIYKTTNLVDKEGATPEKTEEVNQAPKGKTEYDEGEEYEFDDEGEIIKDDAQKPASAGNNDAINNNNTNNRSIADEAAARRAANERAVGNNNADNNASKTNESKTQTAQETNNSTTPTSYSSNGGKYLVLAGSFRIKDNAKDHARKLNRMGYEDASVEIFNNGAFATVLVDRFRDERDAREVVSQLKRKGVSAYVQTKRGSR